MHATPRMQVLEWAAQHVAHAGPGRFASDAEWRTAVNKRRDAAAPAPTFLQELLQAAAQVALLHFSPATSAAMQKASPLSSEHAPPDTAAASMCQWTVRPGSESLHAPREAGGAHDAKATTACGCGCPACREALRSPRTRRPRLSARHRASSWPAGALGRQRGGPSWRCGCTTCSTPAMLWTRRPSCVHEPLPALTNLLLVTLSCPAS